METVVSCQGLNKSYRMGFFLRNRQVLREVTFEVHRGEIFGFLGPNGAGKTTTIKIILGLARLNSGTYSLLGEPAESVRVRQRVGFLPDNPYFYDELSGLQTLYLAGRMFALSGKEIRARSQALLERVALDPTAWKLPVRKYSRGMLQRLGLAQALIANPELLICDEPMEGLDPIGRHEWRDLLRGLRDEGKTIFLSTHIMPDVEALCDRVAMIVGGRVRRSGTLGELLSPDVRGYEISVQGLSEEQVAEFEKRAEWVHKDPTGAFHARFSNRQVADEMTRCALEAGGTLLELAPIRESLDEYFYRLVQEGREEEPVDE